MTNQLERNLYLYDDETKRTLADFKQGLKDKEIEKQKDPVEFVRSLKNCPANLQAERLIDNTINIWLIIFDDIKVHMSKLNNRPRFVDCYKWTKVYRLRFTTDRNGVGKSYFWTDKDWNTYKQISWELVEQNVIVTPEKNQDWKEMYDKELYNKFQRMLVNNARNLINSPYDTWSDGQGWSSLKERHDSGCKLAYTRWAWSLDEEPMTCIDLIYRSLVETFSIEKMWKEFDEKTYDTPRCDSDRDHDWKPNHKNWVENANVKNAYYMLRWVNSREKYILPNNKNFDMQNFSTMTDKRLYVWDILTFWISPWRRHIAIVTEVDANWKATKMIHSYKTTTWVIESPASMNINKVIRPTNLLLNQL